MFFVQHEEDQLEQKRLHCMWRSLTYLRNILLTTSQTFESSMPSRVRCNSSNLDENRVITFHLAVGIMMSEPNWAQSFVPNHKSLSKVRRSISRQYTPTPSRPAKRKRDSRVTPLIVADDWGIRVVGDADHAEVHRDPHVARCVIL